MDIYPVLNCREAQEVDAKIKLLRGFYPGTGWIHLDIADGIFTEHKTWNEPLAWPAFRANFNLEVHLMIEAPERAVPEWLAIGARRVIVHYEALAERKYHAVAKTPDEYVEDILAECWKTRAEAILSTNPETPVHSLRPLFEKFAGAQVLAVHPGLSGQKFQTAMLEKIAYLRKIFPNALLEVDGGMNPQTAVLVHQAGANCATAGQYIFGSPDPAKAYKELVEAVSQ